MLSSTETRKLELEGQIAVLTEIIKAEQDKLHAVRMERAALLCPYKVGDVVVIEDGAYFGRKMRVLSIDYTDPVWPTRPMAWCLHGTILKTDGTPSKSEKHISMTEQRYNRMKDKV